MHWLLWLVVDNRHLRLTSHDQPVSLLPGGPPHQPTFPPGVSLHPCPTRSDIDTKGNLSTSQRLEISLQGILRVRPATRPRSWLTPSLDHRSIVSLALLLLAVDRVYLRLP